MAVRVAVRFHPNQQKQHNESDDMEQNLSIYPQQNCVNVAGHFNLYYHNVLPLHSTQDDIFNIVKPLVDDFLEGSNTSIITYGPSKCGKSYTMFGQTSAENVHRLGLMPRVISYIFDELRQRFNGMNGQFTYEIECSFLEMYNKKIIDLLNPKNKGKIKLIQAQNGDYEYDGLTKETIVSISDALKLLHLAIKNRKFVKNYTKQRHQNENSKSHCAVCLKLIFQKKQSNEIYTSSLVFLDCASYCKSNDAKDKESQYLNRSFLSLGNVITALHRDSEGFIPWKENALTQCLHSLCSSNTPSKIMLFLNCSLNVSLYEETLATLRFGNLAMTDPMLLTVMDSYRTKIKTLHTKMSKYKAKKKENDQMDFKDAQIAKLELNVIKFQNELLKMQSNEQLLRDENDDLRFELNEIKNFNKHKLEFLDTKMLKRTSMIHDTLKRNTLNVIDLNDEEKEQNNAMIDELSLQIENLQNLCSELKCKNEEKDEKLQKMEEKCAKNKVEIDSLHQQILNYKTNYIARKESDSMQNELMQQLKDRDVRIAEYETEISENRQMYEAQIKHLEQQLNESKEIITKQQQQHTTSTNENEQIEQLKEENQSLKLENMRIQSAKFDNAQIAKLKQKNIKLEERLIKARSEKAKMMPALLREKTALKEELVQFKMNLALYCVRWKFIERKYEKQLRDCNNDLARYQRKLDVQIKGKRRMGNQMERLDKMAQNTVKTAVHNRIISSINISSQLDKFGSGSLSTFDLTNGIMEDQEDEDTDNLNLNLQRVNQIIKDLTIKLQKKHEKITELEKKLSFYELSSRSFANLSPQSSMSNVMQFAVDGSRPNSPMPISPDIDYFDENEETKTNENSLNLQSQEQYLKLFLSANQHSSHLPPTPEKTLSLAFFVNKKQIRVAVDVNMTFWDILSEIDVNKPKNVKNMQLHITQNPNPIESLIEIGSDLMNKSFWDLILEFGIFSLLRFDIITNALTLKQQTLQIQQKNVKKTSIFKRMRKMSNRKVVKT